ncbi:MAG: hypothetical protein ACLR23_28225 [Clostridia bacterium]
MPDTLPILKKIRVAVKRLIARLLAGLLYLREGLHTKQTQSAHTSKKIGSFFIQCPIFACAI